MAHTTTTLPFLLFLLLAVSASARPCKNIFFFTSTSYYSLPSQSSSPHYVTLYLTSTSSSNFHNYHPTPNRFFLIPKPFPTRPMIFKPEVDVEETKSFPDLPFHGNVKSLINDRTKDIMSVVGALLFGMGCGALTAATMYLVWSLFMPNRFEFEDSEDEEELDEDLYNPKKPGQVGGYMVVPNKVVDDQEVNKAVET